MRYCLRKKIVLTLILLRKRLSNTDLIFLLVFQEWLDYPCLECGFIKRSGCLCSEDNPCDGEKTEYIGNVFSKVLNTCE